MMETACSSHVQSKHFHPFSHFFLLMFYCFFKNETIIQLQMIVLIGESIRCPVRL
jgi:hypothetical protein